MRFSSHRRGATGMQYASILGLIVMVALLALTSLGGSLAQLMTGVGNRMGAASNGVAGAGSGTGGGGGSTNSGIILWGQNSFGQIGDGGPTIRSTPFSLPATGNLTAGAVTAVNSTFGTSYALAGGRIYAWGRGNNGMLGDGSTVSKTSPTAVSNGGGYTGTNAIGIGTGSGHACAILSTGALACWGRGSLNGFSEGLGIGPLPADQLIPVAVTVAGVYNGSNVAQFSGGGQHSCIRTTGGAIGCTGYGGNGEMGDGNYTESNVFSTVSTGNGYTGANATLLAFGGYHGCMIVSTGKTLCWGYNSTG